MDLMRELVQWVEETKYEDLPLGVIDSVKKLTIDALGVAIAGSSALGVETVADLVLEWGGKGEASVLIRGGKVPAPHAGLVNCTMARALDFGDAHETGGGHLSETFVPVSLILSEYAARPVSGREYILAMALGAELSCRLRCATTVFPGWLAETFAPFGIVATAGKLLGFTTEQFMDGMGIGYSQCSCNRQGALVGALNIRLQQGLAASDGITAAIMAARGITGARDVLEGTYGLYPLYLQNQYKREKITEGLGTEFQFTRTSLKPFPCCKHTHIPIVSTMDMMKENDIKPEEIEEIQVGTNTEAYLGCAVGDNKYRPQSVIDAQFSMPYTVASAAVRQKVFIDDFTGDAIKEEKVLEMARRVKTRVDAEIDGLGAKVSPAVTSIRTKNGKFYSRRAEFVRGSPRDPMTWEECVAKFRRCVPFAVSPVPGHAVDQVIQIVGRLENAPDVREVVRLLS